MNIMNKIKKLQDELPENMESSHLSSNSRTSFQQYKISLKRDTNLVSHILLENAWQKHTQLFEGKVELVSQLVTSQLQGRNIEASKTWKSSLSKFSNSAELFTKNLPSCPSCSSNSIKYTGIKEFQRNCCKCDLGVTNINKENVDARQCKGKSFFKTLSNCKENSDEVMSFEDKSTDLQPRFGRACKSLLKTVKPACNTTQSNFNEKEVEEENKLHQASVAKITFKTAKETLFASNPAAKRTLGATRKAQAKFVSPMIGAQDKQETADSAFNITDDRLKHLDPKMIELIESEIIDRGTPIAWDDIAGLQMAKSVIQEAVVWPLLRPDIFTGLRRPPKGILLFGPPGTGKTLIGKCIAAQCNATFFSISASSLTSKWIGDGEKMVRALFCVARCHQPAVIFIDEIDSLLTQRSDGEHEATRRIKTEFLVQLDGAATGEEDQLLIVGATNRPQELDEAARRRLVKRLYIPLPDMEARQQIIENLLHCEPNSLSPQDVAEVARLTDGFSGADMKSLCSEAAMGPVRAVPLAQIISIQRDKVRPVIAQDFMNALQRVRPSVSQEDLGQYVAWNNTYGHGF